LAHLGFSAQEAKSNPRGKPRFRAYNRPASSRCRQRGLNAPLYESRKAAGESGFFGGRSAPAHAAPALLAPVAHSPRKAALLSRASRVEWALRALWLYRLAPGGRARRSVLSEASTVRRVSWRVFRAAAADLLAGDKRSYEAAPARPHPARPSVMSQQLKSHSR
jgi:hypothetical protein